MANLRTTLRQRLEADAALSAILTGGVFDVSELPQDGGGASYVPRETNGVTIKPHAVIRFGAASVMFEPFKLAAQTQTAEVYVYQSKGYTEIERAHTRIQALLHDAYLTADDTQLAHVSLLYLSPDLRAEELEEAPMRFARYGINLVRST